MKKNIAGSRGPLSWQAVPAAGGRAANIAGGRAAPIGVFDSGIGGLTVLKEIMAALPDEGTIYLGDTARVPYGIRSRETVQRYSFECARFLLSKGIKLLVIACNTVSAVALKEIARMSQVPVIGVIEPGARAALKVSKTGKVGVIGTEATIKSRAYERAVRRLGGRHKIQGLACPLFVPLAEEGWFDNEVARLTAERYLGGLKGIDTLLLGCTHYPLLKPSIGKALGPGVALIDSAVETARETKKLLKRRGIQSGSVGGRATFFVTDSPERFKRLGERFLKRKINNVEVVSLEAQ